LPDRQRLFAICATPVIALLSTIVFPYLWVPHRTLWPALAPFALDPHLHWLSLSVLIARNGLFLAVVVLSARALLSNKPCLRHPAAP